jgi:hypothetical protein
MVPRADKLSPPPTTASDADAAFPAKNVVVTGNVDLGGVGPERDRPHACGDGRLNLQPRTTIMTLELYCAEVSSARRSSVQVAPNN